MGWFEVINTGLHVVNTATNISVASSVNKMQARGERQENAAISSGEMVDIIDRMKRRVKKLRIRISESPQAVLVAVNYYDHRIKAFGISPSELQPSDRILLRDFNEDIDDTAIEASSKLSKAEIEKADECLDAIIELPKIADAIKTKEIDIQNARIAAAGNESLIETDQEWQELSKLASKPRTFRTIGIVLLVLAGISTCVFIPFAITQLFAGLATLSENFIGGLFGTIISLFVLFIYALSIVGGIVLIIKNKVPNEARLKELEQSRTIAQKNIRMGGVSPKTDIKYSHMNKEELQALFIDKENLITSIMSTLGDAKKIFTTDD